MSLLLFVSCQPRLPSHCPCPARCRRHIVNMGRNGMWIYLPSSSFPFMYPGEHHRTMKRKYQQSMRTDLPSHSYLLLASVLASRGASSVLFFSVPTKVGFIWGLAVKLDYFQTDRGRVQIVGRCFVRDPELLCSQVECLWSVPLTEFTDTWIRGQYQKCISEINVKIQQVPE